MLVLSKVVHKNRERIKVEFDFDYKLKEKIKALPTAIYSSSMKAWHLDYNKESLDALKALGYNIIIKSSADILDNNKMQSHNKARDFNNYNSIYHKSNISTKKTIFGKKDINIEIHNKQFFIDTPYNTKRITILKTLKSVWWNNKHKVWIAKASVGNLDILQNNFGYWNQEEYDKIYDMVSLIRDPYIMEIYRTPENLENIWVKISGYKADIDFLKHLPDRNYDKIFKRWSIPNDKSIVERIIEHYKNKGAKIINRLPEGGERFYKKAEISSGKKQQVLIRKYKPEHKILIKKISDVMLAQRYSWSTIYSYVGELVGFAKYIKKHGFKTVSSDTVNTYIAIIAKNKISNSKLNNMVSALKFYFTKVSFRPDFEIDKIKRPRKVLRLPNILSKHEIELILGALDNIKHITILYTLYSSGLRLDELLNLRVNDISFDRNQIFIRQGKGNKDRVVMLSDLLKRLLIFYTDEYKPVYWLFEGKDKKTQYSPSSVRNIVKLATMKAGITKRVTPHKIRHCFATHLLDGGTDIRYIQELLGHKDIKTTLIYTHVTTKNVTQIKSPLDNLNIKINNI